MTTFEDVAFGFALPQVLTDDSATIDVVREVALRSEEAGISSLWVQSQLTGRAPVLEPLTLLAYVSAVTERIGLGTSVLVLPDHNPVQLAKLVTTVDHLSNGRLTIGLGIGSPNTITRVGGMPRDRVVDRFVEAILVMKALWTEDEARFTGDFWQLDGVPMRPRPVQQPYPPLWLGGSVDRALERSAALGNGWMGSGAHSVEQFAGCVEKLRAMVDANGAPGKAFTIGKRVYVAVDHDRAAAERRLRDHSERYSGHGDRVAKTCLYGSEEDVAEGLDEIASAGAELILLNPVFDYLEQHRRLVNLIASRRPNQNRANHDRP
jgi:probable F420-dependent oxidoreductase